MSDWFKNATLVGGSPTQPASKGAAAMSTRAMPTRAAAGQPAAAPAAAGPGDAELTHVAPGLGYNSFTGSKCGYPMEDAPLETIPANATGQKVTYDITMPQPFPPLTGRPATPAEIAELVVFLASEASRTVTGGTFLIDAGVSLLRA